MKKILSHLLLLTILLGVFTPVFVYAQGTGGTVNSVITNSNQKQDTDCGFLSGWGTCVINALTDIFTWLLYNIVLRIASWILYLAGTLLDYVLRYTIIDLKINLDDLTGINITWKVIKDLMNIAFIFILVYKGIELIIGVGSKESIKKFISSLILAALLVNFSLFFTKVLIDASNIVTLGFYKSIIQSAGQGKPIVDSTGQTIVPLSGISTPFMTNLGLSSFWSKANFTGVKTGGDANMLLIPILGAVLFMITAFVFVSISIIFIIRYITLIILLILSPIAYMGASIPGLGKASGEWWATFTGQLTFGPVYMIMTWVVLQLMSTSRFLINPDAFGRLASGDAGQLGATYSQSSISLIFNFIILIGLIIASLTVSKSAASKGSKFVSKAVGSANGYASSIVFGGTAWAGRKSFGNIGRMAAENATLQETAANGKNFVTRNIARVGLYGAKTARDATYDTRNASIPTSMINDVARGTIGRTKFGETFGLNDLQIGNIPVMSGVSSAMGAGSGGTKSVMDERKESADRVKKREEDNKKELDAAIARRDIVAGAESTATAAEIAKMEQSLSKMSDKQIETLVANNKELLTKLNFANSISVKQLEAINKSDQFSDSEKEQLKTQRFSQIASINDAAGIAAIAVRTAGTRPLTAAETAAAKSVDDARKQLKGLSDSELEMIDPEYLNTASTDPVIRARAQEFISQLRPGQAETIINNKSGKFTSTQKTNVKDERIRPLITALSSARTPAVKTTIRGIIKKTDIKTKISYLKTAPPAGGVNIGLDPDVLTTYDIKTLQRMALHDDMTADDISTLRGKLIATLPPTDPVRIWLEDLNKGVQEFPA